MPSYYNGAMETIDVIERLCEGVSRGQFALGNVVKYVARAGKKSTNPAEDWAKAVNYAWRMVTGEWMPEDYMKRIIKSAKSPVHAVGCIDGESDAKDRVYCVMMNIESALIDAERGEFYESAKEICGEIEEAANGD